MANRDCGLAAAVSEAGLPAFRQIAGNPAGQTSTCIRYSLPEKALSMRSLLLSLFALAFFCQPALPAERPNILFIVSEDNSEHLGCYGEKRVHTPHLDTLAAAGLPILLALVGSTVLAIAVGALVFAAVARATGNRPEGGE